ncbi:hypothetical protein DC3_55700 [Deinococcus cellulosilyticus NBRC 106333 = KACC 11606]|uniref:DUF2087 domain-containing protein n=1 Tax=Deinococcus cellulosilyticus (strain DSM 18568 / NBRC 106333 / KACC 11606 / 5516J-15) TaxID=1223518 RepID=A0A511NAS7_DEIC1|nr:hypothetical protein DC3_55700 [Deinococcus cellulosilyticus NBRC 106333 = KACC 11606]
MRALEEKPQTAQELSSLLFNLEQTEGHLRILQQGHLLENREGVYSLIPDAYHKAREDASHPWLEWEKDFYQLVSQAFDEKGILRTLPSQNKKLNLLMQKLSLLFEAGRTYTEKEVNGLLMGFTRDFFLIRRSLIDAGVLFRTPSGSAYWRERHDAKI